MGRRFFRPASAAAGMKRHWVGKLFL